MVMQWKKQIIFIIYLPLSWCCWLFVRLNWCVHWWSPVLVSSMVLLMGLMASCYLLCQHHLGSSLHLVYVALPHHERIHRAFLVECVSVPKTIFHERRAIILDRLHGVHFENLALSKFQLIEIMKTIAPFFSRNFEKKRQNVLFSCTHWSHWVFNRSFIIRNKLQLTKNREEKQKTTRKQNRTTSKSKYTKNVQSNNEQQ